MFRIVISLEQALLDGFSTTLYRATLEKRVSSAGAVEVLDSTMLYDTVGGAAAAGEALLGLFKGSGKA